MKFSFFLTVFLPLALIPNNRFVMHDIFLDGNTFTDSHNVNRNNWVSDFAAGLGISYGKVMISLTQMPRTREFKEQMDNHSFGSITLLFSTHIL